MNVQDQNGTTNTVVLIFQQLSARASTEKFPGGEGKRKKQKRKIASLSLPLLYQYQV